MVSFFLFPFSLLRSNFSIFIVLGLSLAISSGDVRAAVASDQTAQFVQDLVQKIQKIKTEKTDPKEVIDWLSGDGKFFPFDNDAAKPLVRELCLSGKLYGAMMEIPYLRTALKNHKTSKGFLINFFAQRILEKGITQEQLNSSKIAFSHLVRAYQIDNLAGSFPINSSILDLASLNQQDFLVPAQTTPEHMQWFFDNYENKSGQRFRPKAPSSGAVSSGAAERTDEDKPAVAVTVASTAKNDDSAEAASGAGGPELVEKPQTEQERDEAEVIRLNQIWSRVAAARLSGQEPAVDRGAPPIVNDILSDVQEIVTLGGKTKELRTKAKKIELQIKIFPEILTGADRKKIAGYLFLHPALLAHLEGRKALIEYRNSKGRSWLQDASNLILKNVEEKFKAEARRIFARLVQAHYLNDVQITTDTLNLESIPDKSVFGKTSETEIYLDWFFDTYKNASGQGFNGSSPVTVSIPADDYDADEPDTRGAAARSFGVASTVAEGEKARHLEIKEQLNNLSELDTGVQAKIYQAIRDMPVYNDNPVFADEDGRNAHLAGIAVLYAQSVINGKPAQLLELIPEAYPLLIADLSGKGVLESYQTDDGSNLLEYHLGFDSSGAIVNTLLDAGLFNDPHGLDGFASADDYDSDDDVGTIVPFRRTTDHNQVNAYALSQLFSVIEVRNKIKQQALMDTEMSWDYRPHLEAVEGKLVSMINSHPQLLETLPDIYGLLNDYPELKKTLRDYRQAGKTLLQYHVDQGNPWAVAALFDSYYTAEYVITHRELDLRQGTDLAVFDQVRPEYYQRFFKEYKNSEDYSVPELSADVGGVVQSLTGKGIREYEKDGFYSTEERMIIRRSRLYFERMYKSHYFEPRSSSDVPSDTVRIPRFGEELESFKRLFDENPLVIHAADAEGYVPYIMSLYVYMARQDDRAKDFLKSSPNILTSCLENAVRYGSKKFAEGFLEEEGNFVMIFGRLLDIFSEDGSIPSLKMPKSPLLWHFSGASPETQRRFFIGYRDSDGRNVTHFFNTENTNTIGRQIIGMETESRQIFFDLLQEVPKRGEPSAYRHREDFVMKVAYIPELTQYLRLESLPELYPDIVKYDGYRDALRSYRMPDGRSYLQFHADSLMGIHYPEFHKRGFLEDVSYVFPVIEDASLALARDFATLTIKAPEDRKRRQHLEAFQTLVRAYVLDNGHMYDGELNLEHASYWMFQGLPTEIQRNFFISYRNSGGQTILQLLNPSEQHRVQDVVSNVWDYKRLLQGLPYFSLDDPAVFMGHIKQINDQRAAASWVDLDLESQYKWEVGRLIKYIAMKPISRISLFTAHSLLDQVPEIYPHLLLHEFDRDMLRRHSVDGVSLIQYVANRIQRGGGVTGDHFSALIRAYYEDKNEINAETLNLTEVTNLTRLFGSSINQPYVRDFCLRYRNLQGQNVAHLLVTEQFEGLSELMKDNWELIYLLSSKDLSGKIPIENLSHPDIDVYKEIMRFFAQERNMCQLGTPFDTQKDVKRLWDARAVEARIVLTAQSLQGENFDHPPFAKIWQSPYFDKRSGKAIDHADFVNVVITMAGLKVKSGVSDAGISLAFLQEGRRHKGAARRLWKDALEAHDQFLEREQGAFPEEYTESQEEKTLPMAHRVLKLVSSACVRFPGDETRVKMASKLIATGGVFGFRSKKLDVKEAAILVTACEKVAKGYVANFIGQTKMPEIEGLDLIDEHLVGLQSSLDQMEEMMKDVRFEFNVWGSKDEQPELEPIKKGFEDLKKGLLAERVALETEAERKYFIQTFKSALVPLKDIFFSEGLPLRMPTAVTTNRILNHQRICTVISMFSVLKSLEKKSLDALDRVLPTVTASPISAEDRIFNYIDEIFASAEGAAPAKSSRQLFTSACRHLEPDFEFSFGGRAGDYLGGSLHTIPKPLGVHTDRGYD